MYNCQYILFIHVINTLKGQPRESLTMIHIKNDIQDAAITKQQHYGKVRESRNIIVWQNNHLEGEILQ